MTSNPKVQRWVIGLAAFGLTSLVFGGVAMLRAPSSTSNTAAPSSVSASASSPVHQVTTSGPWGELRVNTILLQPPVEAFANISNDCARLSTDWSFPGWDGAKLAEFGSTLFDPATTAALQAASRCSPTGCSATMPVAARLAMPSATRRRLYNELARLGNDEFSGAISLQDDNIDEWLESALERPEDRTFVKGLTFRYGSRISFADAEGVCQRLSGTQARRRFVGALFASEALLVHLKVQHGQALEPLLAYWGGSHKRLKNLEPMLRSLAQEPQGGELDVSHLLPSFARRYLYTFPPAKDEHLNCHWTTLNFARTVPDDALLDDTRASAAFATEYAEVPANERRYGDAVTLAESGGALVHSAIDIASDIVFSKNGRSARRPWALLSLDEVQAAYPRATSVRYLRPKSEG